MKLKEDNQYKGTTFLSKILHPLEWVHLHKSSLKKAYTALLKLTLPDYGIPELFWIANDFKAVQLDLKFLKEVEKFSEFSLLSKFYPSSIFKEAKSVSIIEWLNQDRLKKKRDVTPPRLIA